MPNRIALSNKVYENPEIPIDLKMFCLSCELLSLQLHLFFFHKTMKSYKEISSAWISRAFLEISSSQIDVICVVKIQ